MSGSFDSALLWFLPSLLKIGGAGAIEAEILHIASNVLQYWIGLPIRYGTVLGHDGNFTAASGTCFFYLTPKYFVSG